MEGSGYKEGNGPMVVSEMWIFIWVGGNRIWTGRKLKDKVLGSGPYQCAQSIRLITREAACSRRRYIWPYQTESWLCCLLLGYFEQIITLSWGSFFSWKVSNHTCIAFTPGRLKWIIVIKKKKNIKLWRHKRWQRGIVLLPYGGCCSLSTPF